MIGAKAANPLITDLVPFGTTTIPYIIEYRKHRRHLGIEVHPDLTVHVLAPTRASKEKIHDIVKKKAPWILKKIVWFDQMRQFTAPKEYVNGETFLYLGRQYRLALHNGVDAGYVRLKEGYLEMAVPWQYNKNECQQVVKTALFDWYCDHANQKIDEIINRYATILEIPAPHYKVKLMTKRWGSCTPKNILNFNMKIIMAPASQVEYVVAHELCHIRHKNHSTWFWKHLRQIMPDYEIRRESLRKDGWKYTI